MTLTNTEKNRTEESQIETEPTCEVDGCDKPVHARQWCRNHYAKWNRNPNRDLNTDLRSSPSERKARPRAVHEKRCANCGEVKTRENFYVAKTGTLGAYCKPCHRKRKSASRVKRGLSNPRKPRQKKPDMPCQFEGCRGKGKTYAYKNPGDTEKIYVCIPHWSHAYSGEAMRPLRSRRTSYINDDIRQCTACDDVKPVEQFYKRTDGTYQSQCKGCQGKVNRYNTLMRAGRKDEALSIVETMPERLRKKYL